MPGAAWQYAERSKQVGTVQLSEKQLDIIIDMALDEDTGHGDITSEALIPPDLAGKATLLVKDRGILAGMQIARRVFHHVDPSLDVEILIEDGTAVEPKDIAGNITGSVVANSLLVLGATALIYPITANFFLFLTSAIFMFIMCFLFATFIAGKRLTWQEGVVMILLYVMFLVVELNLKGFF